ncbi:MAG TPA: GtrA family protein [Ktedonobacteraceae bacterium]|jgi:putative flippase GtrA|nr:GtrA family protein [Ktedonobacteraceae bacterium]
MHVIRYALVGGIGIPVNDLALAGFLALLLYNVLYHVPYVVAYPIALVCAFEVSTTVNFVLNQCFTYHEQQQHLSLKQWIKRAITAQITSSSSLLVSYIIALVCTDVLHVNPFISSPIGIILPFFYNYFVSRRFVFRPTAPSEQSTPSSEDNTTKTPSNTKLNLQAHD